MSVETLPHAGIADRLGFLSAFQALVNRFRLPRQPRKADTKHMTVDLAASPAVAASSPVDDHSLVATLTARIETLEADFAKVEAATARTSSASASGANGSWRKYSKGRRN